MSEETPEATTEADGAGDGNERWHLRVERAGAVATVSLARPEVHNAFNPRLIAELHSCFDALSADDSVRAVVLRGDGPSFCAGADLHWMRTTLTYSHDENIADALRMSDMFRAIESCRHPVIGRIAGAALGGGTGLAAVCDVVVASETARFGFTEARLGIAPAVISPFVVRKIGEGHARALFLTAERFDAARARAIGLVHHVVPEAALDETVRAVVAEVLRNGPAGVRAAKLLARTVLHLPPEEARQTTAATIAGLRVSAEGQEGIRSFLEKRTPSWAEEQR